MDFANSPQVAERSTSRLEPAEQPSVQEGHTEFLEVATIDDLVERGAFTSQFVVPPWIGQRAGFDHLSIQRPTSGRYEVQAVVTQHIADLIDCRTNPVLVPAPITIRDEPYWQEIVETIESRTTRTQPPAPYAVDVRFNQDAATVTTICSANLPDLFDDAGNLTVVDLAAQIRQATTPATLTDRLWDQVAAKATILCSQIHNTPYPGRTNPTQALPAEDLHIGNVVLLPYNLADPGLAVITGYPKRRDDDTVEVELRYAGERSSEIAILPSDLLIDVPALTLPAPPEKLLAQAADHDLDSSLGLALNSSPSLMDMEV